MEKYDPIGVVGEGSYGIVLKCKARDSGRIVAIKKFIDSEDDANVRKIALREIRVLRKLRHENLVNLIEVFRRRKHLYLVFEFIDHTLLDQLEQKSHGLDEQCVRKYVFQIIRGLGFCHDNNIIHRDIKPENILVSSKGIIKLCDFGFARNLCGAGDVYTGYVATRWYRAPELLVGDLYGKEVDIWAVGCLFSEMSTGEPLFPGDSDIDQLFLIAQCLGRLSKRHLNIMAKNSAFRGFKYPKSRHGSTTSNKNGTPGRSDVTTGPGSKQNSGRRVSQSKGEESVFASMFPSWSDEAVQLLTVCLDPEPSARPTCNGLLRLPYFTLDNFPTRFIAELNQKLQSEGKPPVAAFSTRKKRILGANVNPSSMSNLQIMSNGPQGAPNKNTPSSKPNLNGNHLEEIQNQLPLPTPPPPPTTNNGFLGKIGLQTSSLLNQPPPPQSNNSNNNNVNGVGRQKTFLVEKNLKDKLGGSISTQKDPSKIPIFLKEVQKKSSDDLILPPSSSTVSGSKSSPNFNYTQPEKLQSVSFTKPESKKYSFSYASNEDDRSLPGFTHPPVTTLSFGDSSHNTHLIQQTPTTPGHHHLLNVKSPGSNTSSTQRKKTVGSTNLFLHNSYTSNLLQGSPQGGYQPLNNINYSNNGGGGAKSLPVSIFGASILKNNGNSRGEMGQFLPRKSPWSNNMASDDPTIPLPFLTLGSPNGNIGTMTTIARKKSDQWEPVTNIRKPNVTFSTNSTGSDYNRSILKPYTTNATNPPEHAD